MDYQRAEAIVLRRQPVTESSLIVTWFSREFGKLKTMAKGARRPKGPFTGKIDLFYRDEIVFLPSRRSDLHLLHDCFLENAHAKLRASVPAMTAASYVCELVDLGTEVEDANAAVFELLASTLPALELKIIGSVVVWFELRFLAAAGWKPKWDAHGATGRVLSSLAASSMSGAQRVRLTDIQLRDAQEMVWQFWDLELGHAPRSRRMLAGM